MKKQGWRTFLLVLFLLAWVFVVLISTELLIGVIMAWALPPETFNSPLVTTIYSVISYGLALFIIVYVPPKIFKKSEIMRSTRERMGLNGLPTWTDIGLAPIGYVASILIAAGITLLFSLFPWFNADEVQELGYNLYMQGGERVLAFISLVILAPIVEELVFRGWLYGKLRLKVPKAIAVLIVSLLFGLVHFQWNVGISVFAMSIITCSLREVTGTIYAGTLVHMINNCVAFFMVFMLGM
ncbi:CPBP family intramembrane metalloprotease [Candidatus Saccharibacteria bacterium]|nr:CPBP family intramembrane metalloprotease [Candidatus Saccharibacteria bacterium]